MKLFSLSTYVIITISFISARLLLFLKNHRSFGDLVLYFTDDKINKLSLHNFLVCVIIFITKQFEAKILHIKSHSIKEIALTKASSMMLNIFLTMRTLTSNNEQFDLDISELLLSMTPVLLFYYSYIIKEAIGQFSMSTMQRESKVHKNIATSEIVFFFVSLKQCFSFMQKESTYQLLLTMNCIIVTIHNFENIIRHTLFLIDRQNFGNSLSIFKKQNIIDICFLVLKIIIELCFCSYIVIKSNAITIGMLYIFSDPVLSIRMLIKKIKGVIAISNVATAFPIVTSNDIKENESCIICRCSLLEGKARKINCGHCFHEDCLYRWLANSEKCPICRKEIEVKHHIDRE